MMMVPFLIALVAVSAAGFLLGYLVALEQDRRVWLPVVEAAAARPVHVIVEHTGPLTPAPEPVRPDPRLPWEQTDGDDTADDVPQRKRVPAPTFYG